jgi:hypothetical protein
MEQKQDDKPAVADRDVERSSNVDASDAAEPTGTPGLAADDPECSDPGPGRDPRPDLRGA